MFQIPSIISSWYSPATINSNSLGISSIQCAAVKTHFEFIIAPPQLCIYFSLFFICIETSHGNSPKILYI